MVYLLFFLSGAAGLIYEIAWSRQLGLFFGHTVHAAAVVLGAYFAGMALGYVLAGRWAPRLGRPLIGYGVAELVVAGWALLTPHLLALYAQPQLAALLNHPLPTLQLAVRALVTFLTLLPATIALGATLPFIAQHVSPPAAPRPRLIALAYACNTCGAFTGVLAATFALILLLGVRQSGYLAAAISAACGLAALWWARRGGEVRGRAAGAEAAGGARRLTPSWYLLAGLSGLGTLGLQVLYTRMFAMTFHNSTYTFGGVVAVFLIALALGSWLVSRFAARLRPAPTAALACAAGAPAILLGVAIFQRFTKLGYFGAGSSFVVYILGALGLIALVVLLPVTLLGTVLPYCFAAAPDAADGPGPAVGRLTAVNTVSAALGALLTSFVLLPLLGLWTCFALYAVLYAVAGLVIAGTGRGAARVVYGGLGLAVLVAAGIAATQWPMSVIGSRVRLLYERETPYGLINVVEATETHDIWLRQNNHYVLGATRGADSELRQGYIPLLLHPRPAEVCFLGLATGITASSALGFPGVERVTAVELIPEVVEAAAFFGEHNRGIPDNPQLEVVVNDARHYLYATDRRFDVIVSDLFVPWHSQTGYLYTVEHYRAARRRLAEGGLFCQWLPMYQVGARELELIADSFASVFPVTTVWRGEIEQGNTPLLALIGGERPLEVEGARLLRCWAQVPVPRGGVDPVIRRGRDVLGLYAGGWPADGSGPLNTDDHPRVEFLAPLTQRRSAMLTGDRLIAYYDSVLLGLPLAGVDYVPLAGEPPPDLARERAGQRAALQ